MNNDIDGVLSDNSLREHIAQALLEERLLLSNNVKVAGLHKAEPTAAQRVAELYSKTTAGEEMTRHGPPINHTLAQLCFPNATLEQYKLHLLMRAQLENELEKSGGLAPYLRVPEHRFDMRGLTLISDRSVQSVEFILKVVQGISKPRGDSYGEHLLDLRADRECIRRNERAIVWRDGKSQGVNSFKEPISLAQYLKSKEPRELGYPLGPLPKPYAATFVR